MHILHNHVLCGQAHARMARHLHEQGSWAMMQACTTFFYGLHCILHCVCYQQVRDGHFRGEQLVYIAALATNALLVFGDRPKDITYRWVHAAA